MTRRIGHLLEFPTLNGGERSLLAFLARVDRARFEPVVLAPAAGRLAGAVRAAGIELRPFETFGRDRARATAGLVEAARAHRLDLLHGNSLAMSLITGRAGRAAGVPSVGHVRDIARLNPTRAADLAVNDVVVAVSEAVAAHLRGEGVPGERITVLHNGVDLETFRPGEPGGPGASIRAELGLPGDAALLLCIGQLALRKGTDVVLRAFAALAARHPQAALLVVGERHSAKEESVRFEAALHRFADEAGLAARIRFLGYRDDVPVLLRAATALVHGAHQEPFGRVLLEASATGLPIVATDVGGTREIVEPGETGLLVPRGDSAAMSSAIATLLDDPAAAARLGRAARAHAVKRFDAGAHARRMHAILQSLCVLRRSP